MQRIPIQLPLHGLVSETAYLESPAGYTLSALNVCAVDCFDRRMRLGVRQGFAALNDFETDGPVQGACGYEAYVDGALARGAIVVQAGEPWYVNAQGVIAACDKDGGIGAAPFGSRNVECVQLGKFVYLVDGEDYWRVDVTLATPQLQLWRNATTPTSGPDQKVVGLDGSTATLIARAGARLYLAGVAAAPTAWWACKVDSADEWNPTWGAGALTDAVAGGSGVQFGSTGDPIVMLARMPRSGVLFGCTQSIVALTNDPAFGDAEMTTLSNTVGATGPRAWCVGPSQELWVLCRDGLHVIAPNQFAVDSSTRVGAGVIDPVWSRIEWSDVAPVLAYHHATHQVLIFLSRIDSPSSALHYAFDVKRVGFWPWKIHDPRSLGALAAAVVRNDQQSSPSTIFGSDQGRLFTLPDQGTYGVDGLPLQGREFGEVGKDQRVKAFVAIGPVRGEASARMEMRDVRAILQAEEYHGPADHDDTDLPTLEVVFGPTAQEALGLVGNAVTLVVLTPSNIDGGSPSGSPAAFVDGGTHAGAGPDNLDGRIPYRPWGLYTAINDAAELAEREYAGPYLFTLKRTSGVWRVQLSGVDEYVATAAVEDVGEAFLESVTDDFPDVLDVVTGTPDAMEPTIVGDLLHGSNDAMRCRVRGEAVFLIVRSEGRPWAIEQMSAGVVRVGDRREIRRPWLTEVGD